MSERASALADLFHHRWAVPAMAELHRGSGSKFVTLWRTLGASPRAMQLTLAALQKRGWVERNPGYGHPLRPEWRLTDSSIALGAACREVWDEVLRLAAVPSALRKWGMASLLCLASGALRFSELAAALPGVTDRALIQTLKGLVEDGLAERRVVPDYPPRTEYEATDRTERLIPLLDRLAIAAG